MFIQKDTVTSVAMRYLYDPANPAFGVRIWLNGGERGVNGLVDFPFATGEPYRVCTYQLALADTADVGNMFIAVTAGNAVFGSGNFQIVDYDPAIGGGSSPGTFAAIANALLNLADGVDAGRTLKSVLQSLDAVLVGRLETVGGVTTAWNVDDTAKRIESTATAGGNRTVPVINPP